jgi:hypothetical protein
MVTQNKGPRNHTLETVTSPLTAHSEKSKPGCMGIELNNVAEAARNNKKI